MTKGEAQEHLPFRRLPGIMSAAAVRTVREATDFRTAQTILQEVWMRGYHSIGYPIRVLLEDELFARRTGSE